MWLERQPGKRIAPVSWFEGEHRMRRDSLAGLAPTTIATAMLLAGCSGSSQLGSPVTPMSANVPQQQSVFHHSRQATSWLNRLDARTRLAYISDTLANNVTVFDLNGTMQGQIGGLSNPGGLFVDSKHNLWVANGGSNNVLEFARGATTPFNTLDDAGAGPLDVTMCANGTVYVAGSDSTAIEVYPRGSVNPTRSLTYPGAEQNDALTCDAAGNVFATIVISFHGGVVEFPRGKQHGATQLPISLGGPGGIKPDSAGNLLVDDQSAQTITEYTEAGSPTGSSIATAFDCINFGVTTNSKLVGCAVYVAYHTSYGQSYTFPGGTMRQTYSGSFMLPYGFAFDPGQKGL
jgi:hypothetical protein